MQCRIGCGACCIAISISSSLPGLPVGKLAGIRCFNLSEDNLCLVHDRAEYPAVCGNLRPLPEMCGLNFKEAMIYLEFLEKETAPSSIQSPQLIINGGGIIS